MRLERRQFIFDAGKTLLAASFLNLLSRDRFAHAAPAGFHAWLDRYLILGEDLQGGRITPLQWQKGMDELYGSLPLREFLNAINFEKILSNWTFDEGQNEKFIHVGIPYSKKFCFETKIAGVKKGRAIPPHGHSNMVSAFVTISGEFHGRLYDKVEQSPSTMIIRPRFDGIIPVGQWSSISDQHHNIHWFEAKSDDAFLFSTKLVDLNSKIPTQGRVPVDPLAASAHTKGTLRVPLVENMNDWRDRYKG